MQESIESKAGLYGLIAVVYKPFKLRNSSDKILEVQ
jgi:hypothetical protein